jgi:predicted PurR-regulated permease PerM
MSYRRVRNTSVRAFDTSDRQPSDVAGAILVFAVGGLVVGWLPDAVIRTRLARETADLPGSLYFIGFTGGLLSVGPVGFIAGALVVAFLVEASELLAAEVNGHGRTAAPPQNSQS